MNAKFGSGVVVTPMLLLTIVAIGWWQAVVAPVSKANVPLSLEPA